MDKKSYTVKDIEAEFNKDFPEMKDIVNFIDPKDYNSIEEIENAIEPFFLADVENDLANKGHKHLEDRVNKNPEMKRGMAMTKKSMAMSIIKMGMPFAMNLSVDENADSMAGNDCLIFGGKEDLSAKDILWRLMVSRSSNAVASIDKNFQKKLEEEVEQHYAVPEELDDVNMMQTFFLDHEIGHAVTMPDIKISQHLSQDVRQYMECIADSYAMIKHYQRYGEDSPMGEYWSAVRNVTAVMVPETVHWTTEAMEKIIYMNQQGLIKDLSPRESIDLAVEIADGVSFGLDEEYNVNKAFDTSPIMDTFMTIANNGLKNVREQKQNPDAKIEIDFEQDIKQPFMNNILSRLQDKNKTVVDIGKIAMNTKSSAVYRVSEKFLGSIDKLWPDVDKKHLKSIYNQVSARKDVPTTEPKLPMLNRMQRSIQHNMIRKKFGK